MKVIFLKDVGGVGQKGDIKEISDGYALNMLIPRGMAKQATPAAIQESEKSKAEHAKSVAHQHAKLSEKLHLVHGKTYTIKAKVNDKGHLFKRIGTQDVLKAMSATGIEPNMLSGADHIKSAGEYEIKIAAAGATAIVKISVVGE